MHLTRLYAYAIAAALTCAVAPPAMAAPTYLTCAFTDGKGDPSPVNITVDEAASSVVLSMPRTGHTARVPGIFSPSEVRFGEPGSRYVLSRVDLSIARTVDVFKETVRTTCALQATPAKRAF